MLKLASILPLRNKVGNIQAGKLSHSTEDFIKFIPTVINFQNNVSDRGHDSSSPIDVSQAKSTLHFKIVLLFPSSHTQLKI